MNLGVALSLLGAMLGYTIISSECPHEAAKQGVFPKVFAKENRKGAPIVTLTVTCLIVQAFLVIILFSEQTYQFFYGVSVSMILIPYFFSSMFLLVCAFKKDGFEGVTGRQTGVLPRYWHRWLLLLDLPDLRGRPYGSHDHDHSVCAGHCFVLVWPERAKRGIPAENAR